MMKKEKTKFDTNPRRPSSYLSTPDSKPVVDKRMVTFGPWESVNPPYHSFLPLINLMPVEIKDDAGQG